MANFTNNLTYTGQSASKPPSFDGTNYAYWKKRMMYFLQSSGYDVWHVTKNGPYVPKKMVEGQEVPKLEEEWDEKDRKMMQINAKATNALLCALPCEEYRKISCCGSCITAKQIWDKLETVYEATGRAKVARIDALVHEYEHFKMEDGEKVDDMLSRFSRIVYDLCVLGKIYTDQDLVWKVFRIITQIKPWLTIMARLQKWIDLNTVTYDELRGNLIVLESINTKDELEELQNKMKKFMTSYKQGSDDVSMSDEEEMYKTFKKECFKRRRLQSRKEQPKGETSKEQIICYSCNNPGHKKFDCPFLYNK